MAIFVISDPHFQHKLVSGLRGFATPEEHDEEVIRQHNKIVKPEDTVYILGDITFSANGKGWAHNLGLVDRMNGIKHMVCGNHDRCSPTFNHGYKHQKEFMKHFESVSEFIRISHDGKPVYLSHYPYDTTDDAFRYPGEESASNKDKYSQYHLRDEGHLIIHGHTHTSTMVTKSALGTLQVNVNLESTDLKPVLLGDIARTLGSRWTQKKG